MSSGHGSLPLVQQHHAPANGGMSVVHDNSSNSARQQQPQQQPQPPVPSSSGANTQPDDNNKKDSKASKPKNPKKYRCTYCDRPFTRSEHRSRHERSHTKEKPFHCPKCPSAFVRRDLLLRHDRTVHAVRNGQQKQLKQTKDAKKQSNGKESANTASTSKRKRGGNENLDVDFNAAVLMTELQHSFHKQQQSPLGANQPKAPPSPPNHEYLPPLNFNNSQHHNQNALDLSSQVGKRLGSPQLSSSAIHAASSSSSANSGNQNPPPTLPPTSPQFHHHHNHQQPPPPNAPPQHQQQQQLHHNPHHQHHQQHSGSHQHHHQQQHAPSHQHHQQQQHQPQSQNYGGGWGHQPQQHEKGYEHPVHIPQLDSSFQVQSLLKLLNEPDRSMTPQPTRVQLNRYMSAYFTFFHPQLPFLHPPTFDSPNVAPSLLLAVCSIGAILCHENATANSLHANAKMLVSSIYEVDKDFPNTRNTPLWATQSLILTLVYSAWSGDPRGLEFISTVRTSLAAIASASFYDNSINTDNNDWKKWLNEESSKRTFFAGFVVFGSLGHVYNYPTALGNSEIPMKIQLPCSELLWNTAFNSESEWMYQYMRETDNSCQHVLFSQALASLTNEQPQSLPPLSPFGLKIMSSALFYELLHSQNSTTFSREKCLSVLKGFETISRDSHPGQGQMVTQIALNSTLVSVALPMEDQMNFLFNGPSPLLNRIRTQHPMLVSAYITSLVTQVRLLVDLTSVQEIIRYHVSSDICNAALSSYTVLSTTGRLRSNQLTGLVSKCFDLYRLPCVLGLRMIKPIFSTPLIASNIESVLCTFELSLVLIMWCHRVEQDMGNGETLDEDEALLYSIVERTCFDCGLEKIHGQLAPTLALFGADLLECVENWGLSTILSLSLRSFGYALFPQQNRIRNSPSAPPPPTNAAAAPPPPPPPPPGYSNQPYPQQSHPQSNLRTTSSERDMFSLPFKAMS